MSDHARPRPRVLVLDTAALLAGTESLYSLYGLRDVDGKPVRSLDANEEVQFFTTPDVIQEVKDPKSRARLKLLENIITLRMPSKEVLAAVVEFAKASGDYSVLSLTDLRVVALARMLEVERNGTAFLKSKPEVPHIETFKGIPSHVLDEMEEAELREQQAEAEENPVDEWTTVATKKRPNVKKAKKKKKKKKKKGKSGVSVPDKVGGVEKAASASGKDWNTTSGPVAGIASTMEDTSIDEGVDNTQSASAAEVAKTTDSMHITENVRTADDMLKSSNASSVDDIPNAEDANTADDVADVEDEIVDSSESTSDSDSEGWITSENVEMHLAQSREGYDLRPEDELRVGCVTTDFAMQNVLLQMGIKVISVDGRRVIRQLRRHVLRCHACTKIERDLERQFCGSCGNATLHRVAYKVDKKGVARVFVNPKRRANLRGTKYSIPMPKGGRHNKDLILREDQVDIVKQRRLQKQRAKYNTDVLDPGAFYNAGAKHKVLKEQIVVGYGRRNPNESRPGSKSRKR